MIRVAVIGYGNIGKAVLAAAQEAPDMEIVGIVRRNKTPVEGGYRVETRIEDLGKVDVALLCLPSRQVPEAAEVCLAAGISTVDSFDIHSEISGVRARLSAAAKKGGAVSVLSAGWDPGSDSVIRALLLACAPKGITHTNFGPGMSMGHSVAARAIKGVKDAISMTIPLGESLHRRMVYVELECGSELEEVATAIKADPYFAHDDTHVIRVDDVRSLFNAAHGVELTRGGVSAGTNNQRFTFGMTIDNPSLTGQIMLSCARAATRRQPGCYTMIELPMVDLLPGTADEWVAKIV